MTATDRPGARDIDRLPTSTKTYLLSPAALRTTASYLVVGFAGIGSV